MLPQCPIPRPLLSPAAMQRVCQTGPDTVGGRGPLPGAVPGIDPGSHLHHPGRCVWGGEARRCAAHPGSGGRRGSDAVGIGGMRQSQQRRNGGAAGFGEVHLRGSCREADPWWGCVCELGGGRRYCAWACEVKLRGCCVQGGWGARLLRSWAPCRFRSRLTPSGACGLREGLSEASPALP